MKEKYLDMKSIMISRKILNKLFNNNFVLLILFNIILLLWYKSYFVQCEQCLENSYCPPCICEQQYHIAYFGYCLNIVYLIYSLIKDNKTKQLIKMDKVLMCFYVLFVNILSYLLFEEFQPICEPCLDNTACPPCISQEQYFIIYFGVVLNIVICVYYLLKSCWNKTKKK